MKNLPLGILLFITLPCPSKAQKTNNFTKTSPSIVVKANNLFHFGKKPLHNYYALGAELGIFLNSNIYLGLSQYGSLAPATILNRNTNDTDHTRIYEYGLQTAYQFQLKAPLYFYTGLRMGYAALHMEYQYNNGTDSDETMTRAKLATGFITPDLKLGIRLHKYLNVETGINYRLYFGSQDKWGINQSGLNGLGTTLSLVGTIKSLKR